MLDALIAVTAPDGDLALMVKPQFEVGKERVGKGGVVRDLELRAEAVTHGGRRGGAPRLGRAGGHHQPAARARRATSSTSSGCGTASRTVGAAEIRAEVRRTADLGVAGERVDRDRPESTAGGPPCPA